MPQSSRTFRIFVSSTFSDLVAERSALQERVFPRLRSLAELHGCRFQAIDLRWGVSEEAALDQQTMNICLGEIERCQAVSPRPNFIVLLGQRYGWRPLPFAISAIEFERLLLYLSEAERALVCWQAGQSTDAPGWYRLDENAVPAEYVLLPRQPGSRYAEYSIWESQVEKPVLEILERAALEAGLDDEELEKYTLSATGQEIVKGALRAPDAPEHVFCYFREIEGLLQDEASRMYCDVEPGTFQSQLRLKERLKKQLPGNVNEYAATWQGQGPSLDHLSALCETIYADLSSNILAEIGKLEQIDPLEKENTVHMAFAAERGAGFVGRTKYLDDIAAYITGDEPQPFVLWGVSGSGKSALLARALQETKQSHFHAVIIARFIGATPGSSNARSLLEELCRQITRNYGGDERTIPTEYRELLQAFPKCLALAHAEKPLVLFVDALDQLSDQDHADQLAWLPVSLPAHVRLILSTLTGEALAHVTRQLPGAGRMEVQAMAISEGAIVLDGWLDGAKRRLTEVQRQGILARFEQSGGLPLYLKLAFEEARQWKSYDQPVNPSSNIPDILQDFFKRLSLESNHGSMLVSRSLGYLAAAKNGLSEDELLDILSLDPDVLADFQKRSPNSPKVDHLPVVIWSRLFLDLEPYLSERNADGTVLISFYHRQLREAVEGLCNTVSLFPELHAGLAEYFADERKPFWLDRTNRLPDRRKTSELAFQQAKARKQDALKKTLTTFDYLHARLAASGPEDLIADYDLAISPQSAEPWTWAEDDLTGLTLIRDGLRLSTAIVANDTDQLIYQLWGRMVGFDLPDVQNLLMQSRDLQDQTWLRPVHPCFTPPGGAELRTLAGHGKNVTSVAISPDGKKVVSGSADLTIKVWDLETGVEGLNLNGHTAYVSCLAITSDGRWIVSGSGDKTIRTWDMTTGSQGLTLSGHSAAVTALAITPDGNQIVSGSGDGTLKIWDLKTGAILLTLIGHKKDVTSVAITPDGRKVISASKDWTHKVWDLKTGGELRTHAGYNPVVVTPDGKWVVSGIQSVTRFGIWDIDGRQEDIQFDGFHGAGVQGIAITPDGKLALTASIDNTVKAWSIDERRELFTLRHEKMVNAVAIAPDGKLAVSACADMTLRVWNIGMGDKKIQLPGHEDIFGGINALAVTRDGQHVLSASGDRTLKVWDVKTGLEIWTLAGHTETVNTVVITPNGKLAVSGSGVSSNELIVWNIQMGKMRFPLGNHAEAVIKVAITPDGRQAVSASLDKTLKVWDVETGRKQFTLTGHTEGVYALEITLDGRFALSGSLDKSVKVWDLKTGAERFTLQHAHPVYTIAITPDGQRAVCAEGYGDLRIWNIETGVEQCCLTGHKNYVPVMAITPDGRQIVSVSRDKSVRVWDLSAQREIWTLLGHTAAIYSLVVTSDGRLAFSASEDKTIKVWDLQNGKCLTTFDAGGAFKTNVRDSEIRVVMDPFTVIAGDENGRIYFLSLENYAPGLSIVTAWQIGNQTAFECPYCNSWAKIPHFVPGSELSCQKCGKNIQLNPFVIKGAEWPNL